MRRLIHALTTLCASGLVAGAAVGQMASPQTELDTDAHVRAKQALEVNPELEYAPNTLLVRFNQAEHVGFAYNLINGRLIREFHIVPGLQHLSTTLPVERAIAMLNALPFVDYAEPDYFVHKTATPNDQYYGLQWGIHNTGQSIRGINGTPDADIDGAEAWDLTTGDANFVVAVIDTGTQWSHPDLDANIWSNPGEIAGNGQDDDGNGYVDDIRGWDFYSNDNNPDDSDGHGTHTAGTVGAEGNNGIGVAGVNWQCKIMPLRFLGPFGGSTSDAVLAVQYAADKGVKVSNNSWGGGGFSQSLYNAIDASKSVGHLFIAAAGNDGVNTDSSPHYPSAYNLNNIISVASNNNQDGLAGTSNYGATSVDLGAPGVDIASTYNGSSYVWSSGTSMACPHVAGVASLLCAANPGWTYGQVRDRILTTVRPVASLSGKSVTGGMLNAFAAVDTGGPVNTAPTTTISSPTNGSSFTEGDSVSFVGSATDNEDGTISTSLVWTSNLQGSIGTGASFSRSDLVVGTHTVTASVTDSGGLSDDDVVTVTIDPSAPGNTPPTVSISTPSNNSTFTEGASVSFSGSATDNEDGTISALLVWTSNLQGQIGNGASFSRSDLVVGTHSVTASVTDSGGLSDSDAVTVIIESAGGPTNPPATPGRPSLSNLGGGNVGINWADNSNDEDSFEIQREKRVGRSWTNRTTIATVGANVTSHVDNVSNGRWRYRVRAVNAAGASSWSSWRTIRIR